MMKKHLQIILLPLFFLLIGCNKEEKKFVIGVSQCSEDIWRNKLNDELIASTYQYDNITLKFASANDNDQLQNEQIKKFIQERVDLIIVSPNQINTVSSVLDEAYDKGIPIILFDRKSGSEKYTAFIGADNFEAGKTIGEYVVQQLGGKGNVVEITGLAKSSPAIERHKGFMYALSQHPDIRLVDKKAGDWLKEGGRKEMKSMLAKNKEINFVFGQNDRMAIGAAQAAESMGVKNIRYVGIDALPVPGGGLENVRNGRLIASYIYPTRGDLVMQLAVNILEKRPFQRDNYLKGALVTQSNAKVLLMQYEELSKQRSRLYELHGKVDQYLAQYNHQKIYIILSSVIILLLMGIIVYVYRTMLQKRQLEEETTNAKLQFFTNISHELRTPLTLIADPIESILIAENLNKQQKTLLQIVHRNVNILTRLLNEILDFRKIQNKKMQITVSEFNLSVCLQEWLDIFRSVAEKKNIRLSLEVPSELLITADVHKVERICYNLLSNALKYTNNGGSITLAAKSIDENVEISVSDTGKGIAKEELKYVFDRFYQVKANHKEGGTGIGLAIVKAFTEIQGGKVRVESQKGQGATFIVLLPKLVKGEAAEPTEDKYQTTEKIETESIKVISDEMMNQKATSADYIEKPSLLVIDDNADIRAYIMALLAADYNISIAENGEEGLKKAIREVPDVIVCDVMMPVMDGLEVCRHIKADALTSHIPIVLLTAHTLEEQRTLGYERGADAYLTKPFKGEVLKARLKNLIDNRKLMKIAFGTEPAKPSKTEPAKNPEHAFIEKFRTIVQTNMRDPDFNIDRISSEMGISRAQLYRKIKSITGSSPIDIIREARLKRADRLIETTSKSIAEIAYEVGFSSPSYFTKCYKEHFGYTPKAKQ